MTHSSHVNGTRPVVLSDRQGFDRRWFASGLEAVYVPQSDREAVDALDEAIRSYGHAVKFVSGRHCYENFVYNVDTRAIIDTSALNRCEWSEAAGAYVVEAGCENWTVYRTLLNGYNKTLPAGSCYSVGAGGHITGGGYGLLSRLHGLTVDHLTAVDIVVWDASLQGARLIQVSESSASTEERDLFWALRGAGCGNFGLILRYYFRELPDAPEYASIQTLAWDWSEFDPGTFAEFLICYSEFVASMPESNFSLLKLNHVAAGQIGMIHQCASAPGADYAAHRASAEASAEAARAQFDRVLPSSPLRAALGGHPGWMRAVPTEDQIQHVTYLEALQTLNSSGPNQFGKYKSAYMNKAFPREQSEAIYRWLNTYPQGVAQKDMQQSLLQVDSYGGAINEVPPDATAVPQRSAIMKLQYQTYWDNSSAPGRSTQSPYREQAEAHVAWIDEFYRDVYAQSGGFPDPAQDPSGTVAGAYYNYPDRVLGTHEDGQIDRAMWLYFLENYRDRPRNLMDVKRHWDPENLFRHLQSIPV